MHTASAILIVLLSTTICAVATENTLYSFTGSTDGGFPYGGLVMDKSGNLYGTTILGGTGGQGVVFELVKNENWQENVIHNFSGPDGAQPAATLIFDKAGNLYGTTQYGGTNGCGTVFELTPSQGGWTEKVLWSFNQADGEVPNGLVFDAAGNLYGTTQEGGGKGACDNGGCGVIFKLYPGPNSWSFTVLHRFTGGLDGASPQASLIVDSAGNLYGTAEFGGPHGSGVVFESTSSGEWKELFGFAKDGSNGAYPGGPLVFNQSGNLFGTTTVGGAFYYGVVFELNPQNGSESTLYSFTGGLDQGVPVCGLTFDNAGNLYGTTSGADDLGFGTVFGLTPALGSWKEATPYSFTGYSDGDTPFTGVILDEGGNLFGTSSGVQGFGHGAVYEILR